MPHIFVMNADGSYLTDVTKKTLGTLKSDLSPNWQPIPLRPVGGIVMPTNKLEILTPYLALTGLIIAVSAVVVIRKRRD
jgi:hypothetical protein